MLGERSNVGCSPFCLIQMATERFYEKDLYLHYMRQPFLKRFLRFMYQGLSIAAVGSSDESKLSLGKRPHRIVRGELFNFFLSDAKFLVDLLQNMLQRGRFNAVHHIHSLFDIL